MFEIYDGRKKFYQWDSEEKLIVDELEIGNLVHFANFSHPESLTVKIKELDGHLVCDVPNILLQSAEDICVYAYVKDDKGNRTILDRTIAVQRKKKPTDYVYTPTELKDYSDLEKRIIELEKSGVSPETISKAVDDYLTKNPIEVDVPKKISDLSDDADHRTVTDKEKEAWNGKLDESKLPEAVNKALAQAKSSGEFDGKDGITPHIGANGNWYIGTTDTGIQSRGQNGYSPVKGKDYFDGEDGKTPEKGVDYFTDADKSSFVQDVLNALPTWQGGAF